jgi:probable F420-dependent oxidoreductase
VKYAIDVPNFGSYGDARALAELAREAEQAGWDGFFIWDHMQNSGGGEATSPMCDPWVALAAVAMTTERIRIGTMVTPVARRRPWKLARETVTLDRLSRGRLTLGVGLGHPPEEYAKFGDDADLRTRAEKLDEGLAVLAGLWSAKPFSYAGKHFRIDDVTFEPPPLQQPRIPVWVASWLARDTTARRAARWDGIFPIREEMGVLAPDEVAAIVARVRRHRTSPAPFDVAIGGESSPYGPFRRTHAMSEYEAAGVTWWMESLTDWRGTIDNMSSFVRSGPPAS